jgi:uncharacterized repeat protein (TIGR01451 family)
MKAWIILCLFLLSTSLASTAVAQGVFVYDAAPAGTVISNQAFVDYRDGNGNTLPRAYSNTVVVTVTQVAGVSLWPETSTQTGSAGTRVAFIVQIFNDGNGADSYNFTYNVTSGWTPDEVKFYRDVNHNRVYDPATDTQETPVTGKTYRTGVLQSATSYDLIMVITIPSGITAEDFGTVTITATSLFNQTVSVVGTYTAKVTPAVITIVTTHTPSAPRPGDVITYTVTVSNTGSMTATGLVVTNVIPAKTVYLGGTTTLDATFRTDITDGDEVNFNTSRANAVTVALGSLAPGTSRIITFQVTVPAGTAAGTVIAEQAEGSYLSGPVSYTVRGTLDTDKVAKYIGIDISPVTQSQSGNPGDQKEYLITLTNYGNSADTARLVVNSSSSWQWGLNGQGTTVSIGIAAGGVVVVRASTTVPAGTPDRLVETATMVCTSTLDPAKTSAANATLTVTAPVFSLTKAVTPTGTQPPGTILTYTVTLTNSGTGLAKQVVVSDPLSPDLLYVSGSIKVGPTTATLVAKSDGPDGDGAMYNAQSTTVVVGDTATWLLPGVGMVFQFAARIK